MRLRNITGNMKCMRGGRRKSLGSRWKATRAAKATPEKSVSFTGIDRVRCEAASKTTSFSALRRSKSRIITGIEPFRVCLSQFGGPRRTLSSQ